MKRYWLYILLLPLAFLSCEKDEPLPDNPYDSVNYETPPPPVDTLNKESFVWLHQNIFTTRCATPGCHDGHFEPDFRTLGSSYATLVYHPILKNNVAEDFTYRVVPYDTAGSVLHERLTNCCFVNQDDRMPQDVIGVPLQDTLIAAIEGWIMNGAKDMFGQVPPQPDRKPIVEYYAAISTNYQTIYSNTNQRIDSVYYNPFIIVHGTEMLIGVQVKDDLTPISGLRVNKLRTSYSPDDFTPGAAGYKEYNAYYISLGQDEFWVASVNTVDFSPGNVVYMRYYVNDGEHADNVEMPNDELPLPYKTFWSFYVDN